MSTTNRAEAEGLAARAPAPAAAGAQAPETLEGWYALHQIFRARRGALRRREPDTAGRVADSFASTFADMAAPVGGGWSVPVTLIGSTADLMLMHFRPTLEGIGEAQRRVAGEELAQLLEPVYSFLSVTEAGLYHLSAQLSRDAVARGGAIEDEEYRARLAERLAAERENPQVRRRLFPSLPPEMPYVCFYPMSKRRATDQNWYALSLEERSRLMYAHGATGRRYAGRVVQVITGAIGLDAWEWGVTLFARDPLDFKKLVTEMRFDEVSARFAEFGPFYVGKVSTPSEWLDVVG